MLFFFFSSRRRHTRSYGDWSSDVCSSDLSLLHRLDLADLRRGASIASGHAGVGVRREREITMNQINLSGADVVVHEQSVGGGVERPACRTLVVTELFHDHRRVFRAKGLVRIDV